MCVIPLGMMCSTFHQWNHGQFQADLLEMRVSLRRNADFEAFSKKLRTVTNWAVGKSCDFQSSQELLQAAQELSRCGIGQALAPSPHVHVLLGWPAKEPLNSASFYRASAYIFVNGRA